MRRGLWLLAALLAGIGAPAGANIVQPPSYEQLMADSTLVVIGTVTDVNRGATQFGRNGPGATATLSVQHVVKGEAGARVTVGIYHPVAELNPRCCEVGAIYVMFLRPSARDGQPIPVWTDYAMVRIVAPARPSNDPPPRFEELMASSAIVVIGTVTRERLEQNARESWVTLSVAQVLKGFNLQTLTISNDEELNPRCCRVGAAYIFFLQPNARDGRAISPWGPYGIVRIAAPPGPEIRILPDNSGRQRN